MPQGHDQQLPFELAEALGPHLQRALEHPVRRRILRALNGAGETRTLEELTTLIPGTTVGMIHYHAGVLEECGSVSITVSLPGTNSASAGNRYASNIADDRTVMEALSSTREVDES